MAYTKTNWEDLPSTDTPVDATNLQNAEDGIEEAHNLIDEIINGEIYSMNETKTNKVWINGKQIYRKVINTSALPNASNKSIPHNITNLETITSLEGTAYNPTANITYTLPHVHPNDVTYQVGLYINGANIIISTGIDRSAFTQSYVIIEYTKGD